MSGNALRLSISEPYTLRWPDIRWNPNGAYGDPRPIFTPQFQLLTPGAAAFDTWIDGEWDTDTPSTGPYSATCTIGPGQPEQLNPATAGLYVMHARLDQDTGETPEWSIGTVILEAP